MQTTLTQSPPAVKRRRTTEDYNPPEAPWLTVEYQYSKGCKASGESGYSLGSPAEPPSVEIIAITDGDGKDITGFLTRHDFDFSSLETAILASIGDAEADEWAERGDRARDEAMDR